MKKLAMAAATVLLAAAPATASDTEINYPEGSLGFAALMDGDFQSAREMIEADDSVESKDPAKLLNLGYAYERLGNRQKAQSLYERAYNTRLRSKLILASGDIVDSKKLAGEALERLSRSIATN